MPTSCWKTERPMPIQTIGRKPKRPPSRSLKVDLCSLLHRVLDLGDAGVQVDVLALDLAQHLPGLARAGRRRSGSGATRGSRRRAARRATAGIDHDAEHPLPGLEAGELAALVAVGERSGCPS